LLPGQSASSYFLEVDYTSGKLLLKEKFENTDKGFMTIKDHSAEVLDVSLIEHNASAAQQNQPDREVLRPPSNFSVGSIKSD
jgi:hypothetical protein